MPTAWPTICAPTGGRNRYTYSIINEYTEPDILPGKYPIFLMKVQGPDDACVFLKEGACSVYPARPRACRLYPFTVDVGVRAMTSTGTSAWTARSTSPEQGLVKDWFYQNFSKEERTFVLQEWKNVPEIGNLIRNLDDSALDAAHTGHPPDAIHLLRPGAAVSPTV